MTQLPGLYSLAWVTPDWAADLPFQIVEGAERADFRARGWHGCQQFGPSNERTVLVRVRESLNTGASFSFPRCGKCSWCLDIDKKLGHQK